MENNLNYKGIEAYSQELSQLIVDNTLTNKNARISGKDILELTPVRQVNLFVVKNLFAEWQNETKKIKSPYFDYSNEKVKSALKKFMNILSQHIAVDGQHLQPLLTDAIKEAILLIFSPYDFYTHQIDKNESLALGTLKSYAKYVKINEKIYKSLIEKLEKENITTIDHQKMVKSLNEVFEKTEASPEDVEDYLQQFSELMPLDESTLYGKGQLHVEIKDEESSEEDSFENPPPINEQYDTPFRVLNDELANENKPSLADLHQQQKITSIEKHLSINQRYMFVKVLFEGDEEAFKQTIQQLESMDSKKSALNYINENHSNWDFDSEEVEEFIEIVEKRLA